MTVDVLDLFLQVVVGGVFWEEGGGGVLLRHNLSPRHNLSHFTQRSLNNLSPG